MEYLDSRPICIECGGHKTWVAPPWQFVCWWCELGDEAWIENFHKGTIPI